MASLGARLLVLACLLGPVGLQGTPTTPEGELERFFEQTQSLTAFFQQEVRSAEGDLLSSGHGDMSLLRPNFMRWNYREPEPLVLVSDGVDFWSYDPVLEQATVTRVEDALDGTPLSALLGSQVLGDLFAVKHARHQDGIDWIMLQSRAGAARPVELLIGLRSGLLERLHFMDQFGQEVQVRFERVQVNPPLQPEFFSYRPPHGTDILGTPTR